MKHKGVPHNNIFDVVVVGGGMGGLLSAALLSVEGFRVAVLEKNRQIGGSLQSFGVDKKRFESAVHYIGSLAKGQTLYKIFNYLGFVDDLSLKRLDADCFDRIIIGDKTYSMAQGHEHFTETLAKDFPHQTQNLVNYLEEIKNVCDHFPLYNLRMGTADEKQKVLGFGLQQKMDELFSDELLKQVLTANNMLYGGDYITTPFYIHALIENSYIESSWKCEAGSMHIAVCLQDIIQKNGGRVYRNCQVRSIKENEGLVEYIETEKGDRFFAKHFISNLHPAITYSMLDSKIIRQVTKKRIDAIPNTLSAFMLNISLKEEYIEYQNYNTYYHRQPDVWLDLVKNNNEIPNSFALFFYQDQKNKRYAQGLSILTYMHIDQFSAWLHTAHTSSNKHKRGADYLEEKNSLAWKYIEALEAVIPGLANAVQKVDVSSPLTYRDYLNIPQGAMYGMKKEVGKLDNTTFATRTKIPNLFLTGQNINMHGILGVSITAVLTVGEMIGLDYLVKKINEKNN